MARTFACFTPQFYSRGLRFFVPYQHLHGSDPMARPGLYIETEEVDAAGEYGAYDRRRLQDNLLPGAGIHAESGGLANLMNRADVEGGEFSGEGDPFLENRTKYGPLETDGEGSGMDIYYEDFACAMANVKTWNLSGSLGTASIDVDIPAGLIGNFDTDSNLTTPLLARPNSGKRGYYGFGVNVSGEVTGGDPPESGSLNILVGWGEGLQPYNSQEEMNVTPTPYVMMPRFYFVYQSSGDTQRAAGFDAGDAPDGNPGEKDPDLTFCGHQVRTYTAPDSSKPDYSLEISAGEMWEREDEWYNVINTGS